MTKLSLVLRIALIIFLVEGLIMIVINFVGTVSNIALEAFLDAFSLTLFSSPLIYYYVIYPYVTKRTKELNEARERADKANLAKSKFLAHMSHELRTPLNAITGFSSLLELDEQLNKDQLEQINEIHNAGDYLLKIINELLDLSKIESGAIDLKLENMDLQLIVDECLALTRPAREKRKITLSVDDTCGSLVKVYADRARLRQVVLNLISNAIKYNHPGGSIRIECRQTSDDKIRLSIKDTGMGISKEQLVDVFNPFNRLGAELGAVEGTGIGLTITKQLIEIMGGSIGVESEQDLGSTFWVDLQIE